MLPHLFEQLELHLVCVDFLTFIQTPDYAVCLIGVRFHSFQIPWLTFFKNQFENITVIEETEEVVVYATRYLQVLSPVITNATKT